MDQALTVNVGVTQTNTSEEEEADFIKGDSPVHGHLCSRFRHSHAEPCPRMLE